MREYHLEFLICLAMTFFLGVVLTDDPSQSESKTWTDTLPGEVRSSILWSADHEEGTLFDWVYDGVSKDNGGGVFNTGSSDEAVARVSTLEPFTGKYCAEASIHGAFQSQHGSKAVRLMRWTDKPWNRGGKIFPSSAYYGVWLRIDKNYQVRNAAKSSGGWWNVFQFKSNDENGNSQPVWVLNVGNKRDSDKMHFYLYSKCNRPKSVSQKKPIPIPIGRWFHVEAIYEQSSNNSADGRIAVWQDGKLILQANNVVTVLAGKAIWGIGNYTDHISGGEKPGTATIYFDDATIATKPTHKHAGQMLNRRR